MEETYYLVRTKQGIKRMKAEVIYNKVMETREKAYHTWFADILTIYSKVDTATFPWDYASDIKVAILNCFANLELTDTSVTEDEKKIVDKIYNDFYGSKNPNEIIARRNMLCAVILGAERKVLKTPLKEGEQLTNIRVAWRAKKFEEYVEREHVNLYVLCDIMEKDLNVIITEASKQGMLDLDKENTVSENGGRVITLNR